MPLVCFKTWLPISLKEKTKITAASYNVLQNIYAFLLQPNSLSDLMAHYYHSPYSFCFSATGSFSSNTLVNVHLRAFISIGV